MLPASAKSKVLIQTSNQALSPGSSNATGIVHAKFAVGAGVQLMPGFDTFAAMIGTMPPAPGPAMIFVTSVISTSSVSAAVETLRTEIVQRILPPMAPA